MNTNINTNINIDTNTSIKSNTNQSSNQNSNQYWQCGNYLFQLPVNILNISNISNISNIYNNNPLPLIQGILNTTPDSFSDGQVNYSAQAAIAQGMAMVAAGANIIDVGGESTRPGYTPVPVDEELRRVLPVVAGLAAQGICVSIDTHKPVVMQAALQAGAAIINDVNALHSEGALAVVQGSACGLIIMDGFSKSSQAEKQSGIGLSTRLANRYQALLAKGIAPQRLMLDPGIGFDKRLADNLACVQQLPELLEIAPVLIGGSRKSMLGLITGKPIAARTSASVALALLAAQRGVSVLRVHDVSQTLDALKVWQAVAAV